MVRWLVPKRDYWSYITSPARIIIIYNNISVCILYTRIRVVIVYYTYYEFNNNILRGRPRGRHRHRRRRRRQSFLNLCVRAYVSAYTALL